MWDFLSSVLPHATASLNTVATILLIAGFVKIRQGKARQHRNLMLSALAVSSLFLLLYLLHKLALFETTGQWNKRFPSVDQGVSPLARSVYFAILFTHLPLAMLVPPLAIRAVYLARKGRIAAHKRLVRWTFPIWIYVSVTGVLVYLMLYQLYAR